MVGWPRDVIPYAGLAPTHQAPYIRLDTLGNEERVFKVSTTLFKNSSRSWHYRSCPSTLLHLRSLWNEMSCCRWDAVKQASFRGRWTPLATNLRGLPICN